MKRIALTLTLIGALMAPAQVAEAHPQWVAPATITPIGHPSPGNVLLASGVATSGHTGTGHAPIVAVSWERCGALWLCNGSLPNNHPDIEKYRLTEADVGKYIRVHMVARDTVDGGTVRSTSVPFGPIQEGPLDPPATASSTCTAPQANVIDGYAGSTYSRLAVQRNSSETLVCFRIEDPRSGAFGGRVRISDGSATAGVPSIDTSSGACAATGNQIPEPNGEDGQIGGNQFLIDTYAKAGEASVCFELGSEKHRIKVPLPGVGTPDVKLELDSPATTSPPPDQGPVGYPSSSCQAAGESGRIVNTDAGPTHVWLYKSQPSANRVELCLRAQGGGLSHGGRLIADTGAAGAPLSVTPGNDLQGCEPDSAVTLNNAGVKIWRSTSPGLPATICVQAGGQTHRVTVNGPFLPSGQTVRWEPDPGTPLPGIG